MGVNAKPYDFFENTIKRPMRITIIIFVTLKVIMYWLVAPAFVIHRIISGVIMLVLVFTITGSKKLSKRQISIFAPFSLCLVELIVVSVMGGDRLVYIALIGCALVSLTYLDVVGLTVMTSLTTAAAAFFTFILGAPLMGEQFNFYDNLMGFIGMVTIFIIILLLGKFSVNTLVELQRAAESATRSKSEFLATMSHEIRTPLNAIIGLTQVELQKKSLPESTTNNIELIYQSGSHLLGIIGDTLDLSKIEAGSFELIPVEYETPSLISQTIDINLIKIGSKPITFALEINGDFPLKLKGDELRVRRILNNLLSNAAKYTNQGKITLTVEHELHNNAALVRFIVRDTGIGIRAEDKEKLFSKYTQLDAGTNRKTEGTGLGLSIAQKLAQMMGGDISVESEYGKGSVFTAVIMQELVKTADGAFETIGDDAAKALRFFSYADVEKKDAVVGSRYLGAFTGRRVLVVDDLPLNLYVARDLLLPYGFMVDAALSGSIAIEKVQQRNYDLILMDHMMPEMDGVETVAELRKLDGFNTPIVALTANALRGMNEYYLEHGFQDYLTKPIIVQALDAVLAKWIKVGSSIEIGLEMQRLDKLKHYRVAFDSGREIDDDYFDRFITFIKTFKESGSALIEAAQNRDTQKIRAMLPALCATLQEKADAQPVDNEAVREIIQRLKGALQGNDAKEAGRIVTELGAVRLSADRREWYFTLYDLVMEDKIQEALERVEEWLKY